VRHVKAGYFTPVEMSWPVLSSDNFSSQKLLYLLIHIQGYDHNEFRGRDAQLLNMFTHFLQTIIEKYFFNLKSKECYARSLKVLIDIRPVLAETNHAMLFHKLNECLPRLFGFKKAAVLLKQAYGMQLYNVAVEDPEVLAQLYKDC